MHNAFTHHNIKVFDFYIGIYYLHMLVCRKVKQFKVVTLIKQTRYLNTKSQFVNISKRYDY